MPHSEIIITEVRNEISTEMSLLCEMVTWNAARRWTADQCLKHKYFTDLVIEDSRNTGGENNSTFTPNQDFEDWKDRDQSFWARKLNYLYGVVGRALN